MEEKLPAGLIIVRIINIIGAIFSLILGILMAMIAVPNFIKAAQNAHQTANPILLIVVGLISVLLGSVPGMILLVLNKYLKLRKKSARIWQIVIACIMLLSFPIGTVLGIVVLYFMLFDKKTKEAFVS